ncbi:DUF2273 domain-containing protein [Eubacteriales bacterium OttesenSCG-928-K08]|nr:DUF2273 domain-containing protein [Eubacteriales bacterium OttesenSCG-928-K08]
MKDQIKQFLSQHRWTVILVLAGLLLFVLLLTIGFWKTLLLFVVLGLCLLFGTLLDKGGWDMVKRFFNRMLPK